MSLAYFTYFEGGPTGQTLGKKALGIRVYDFRQGGPIGYGRASCARSASTSPRSRSCSATSGCCGTRRSSRWQDKIAGSVVVPADAYR